MSGKMIKDGKCTFCGTKPERKINRQPLCKADKNSNIVIVEPKQMIDYAYYQCNCGMRYTPEEIEERNS